MSGFEPLGYTWGIYRICQNSYEKRFKIFGMNDDNWFFLINRSLS